jgi:hypothetical protein
LGACFVACFATGFDAGFDAGFEAGFDAGFAAGYFETTGAFFLLPFDFLAPTGLAAAFTGAFFLISAVFLPSFFSGFFLEIAFVIFGFSTFLVVVLLKALFFYLA